jgi:23S rRNA pseudouridine955/2504/2580 synthase
MMPVEYVDITNAEDAGQRIDNFLLRSLKGLPRQRIYKILRSGEVRVNGGRIKPSHRLELGDRIRIPPVTVKAEQPVQMADATVEMLEAAVLYEDNDLIALNKPSGFAVHGGSSITSGVIELFRAFRQAPRLELAHRIDRDTSGCLLLCKRRSVLTEVQAAFRERIVKKKYDLYVAGAWPKSTRTVSLRLQRYETAWGERRVRTSSAGQLARTDFAIVAQKQKATHLAASLHTGRTHQIRVHTQSQQHPILGDDKYSESAELTAPRLCLHASRLVVPIGDDRLDFQAPLPDDMRAFWKAIK